MLIMQFVIFINKECLSLIEYMNVFINLMNAWLPSTVDCVYTNLIYIYIYIYVCI